jgi:hypothetical protein
MQNEFDAAANLMVGKFKALAVVAMALHRCMSSGPESTPRDHFVVS